MGNLSNPNAFSGIVKGLGEGGSSVDFPTDISNPQDGQLLKYDATSEKWVNVDDEYCVVDITNPQDGQLLQYDATSEKWVNSGVIRFINEIYEDNHICTQDDIDNYGIDNDTNALILGNNYSVIGLEITYNDLLNRNILNIVVTGSTGTQDGNYYFSYGLNGGGDSSCTVEDFSMPSGIMYNLLDKDVYLKSFIKNFN